MQDARLAEIFSADQLLRDEPMSRHTTMRVGGPAELFALPETPEQLIQALAVCPDALVIGNGSNLIVRDGGVRGLVISTASLNTITVYGNLLRAQAGAMLASVAREAFNAGLSGLEFVSGIPGSVGGGCAMNAGAYGEQISDVLVRARVLMDGEDGWFSRDELEMGYRSTRILAQRGVVLEAEFELRPSEKGAIRAKMDELNRRRRDKQPLEFFSSGSTFKRPEGHFAGALIEDAGLKGLTVGGARVSEKHAGFVVNMDGASARDVLELIELVKRKVWERSGVRLECEVRIVGEN